MAAFMLLAQVGASPSCGGGNTHIARGEAYSSGNKIYDEYFNDVLEVRKLALEAGEHDATTRERLRRALGLEAQADLEEAVEAARERVKRMRDNGIMLHLVLTPEVKLVKVEGTISLDPDGNALLATLEESAKASLALSRRLDLLPERILKLEKRRAELRGSTEQAFRGEPPAKRREIERELDASGDILSDAADASDKHAGTISKFLLDLAHALETGGATAQLDAAAAKASAAASAPPPPPAKPAWGGGARWRPPARGGSAPTTTPPAKPPARPAGDDFDP